MVKSCSNEEMHFLARVSVVGIFSLGFGIGLPAFGQVSGAGGTGGKPDGQHGTPTGVGGEVPADSSVDGRARHSVSPAEGRETDSRGSGDGEKRLSGGGYSWSEKRAKAAHGRARVTLDPKRPLAHAPNFEMRPDGSSVLTVVLSHLTEVTRTSRARHVEYYVKDAQVGVLNNLNPLVTAHFASPLERAVLRRNKHGLTLLLTLREDVQPIHQVRVGPAGSAVLEVTLPRPSRTYPAQRTHKAEIASDRSPRERSHRLPTSRNRRGGSKGVPGPLL